MWRSAETEPLASAGEPGATARGGRSALAPEWVFLLIAIPAGLLIAALITPLVGGNEVLNFQRAATIANGHPLVGEVAMPGGIVDLIDTVNREFPEGSRPPYALSEAKFAHLAALDLRADQPKLLAPNPIAVLHPLSYLPQVPVIAAAMALGVPPLAIFYLGRLAGLIAGIALTFAAIRVMPVRNYSLAALALLPPVLFSRSTLDADQFTNGLAFLFLAMVIRAICAKGEIKGGAIAAIALAAFVIAQAKSAYLLLPLLTLAIPTARFGSARRKTLCCALVFVPGFLASAGWMLLLKQGYFASVTYSTWSGMVDPTAQAAFVLAHPFGYAEVLLRTVFGTLFLPRVAIEFFGAFGPPVRLPIAIIAALAMLTAAVFASEEGALPRALGNWRTKTLALAIAAVSMLIVLTLLYVQWTRLGGPVIDGFLGRYLYPVAPLLLIAIPLARKPPFGLSASLCLPLVGLVSAIGTCWMTWHTYVA